ncbi:MAG TPA: acyl-CoA dehydrogenase family protein [Chitinivibrionales bacterium]|nr:acyl-CoA dehydrogenase family protein [Chitinivibrionales bacterium]
MDFNLSPLQKMIQKTTKDFCDKEVPKIDAYMAEHDDYPPDLVERFAKAKLLGMDIPKELGGTAGNNFNMILIAEEMAKTGTTATLPLFMNNSVAETIFFWGSDEIKEKFIPPLCDGSAWATMAFTEPGTGSDPRALTTTAELQGDEYILNGTKRFISMASKPGYGVFYVKDLSLEGERADTTALIIDKETPGITFSDHYKLMGMDGSDTCDVFFKDVAVPKENILGEPGKGFKILLRWIAGERIQQAAGLVGTAQAALDEAVKYARQRMVNGAPLGMMQGFTWMIADMKTKVDACRLMVYNTIMLQDDNKPFEVPSAELKVFVVPMVQEVCRMAVQIHGSYGYSKEYKVEKLFRYAMHGGIVASSIEVNKTIAGQAYLAGKQQ